MTDSQPDNVPGNAPGNAASGIEAQPFSVGATLREARVRLGLSVADVAHRIKFAPRQIEALEADDFAHLPEAAFVRGFVRSYARLLQLDPSTLVAALPGAPARPASLEAGILAEVPFANTSPARKPNVIWLAAALAVAVALGLFVLLHDNQPDAPTAPQVKALPFPAGLPVSSVASALVLPDLPTAPPQIAASAPSQTVTPPAKAVAQNSASKRTAVIHMEFDEESWVEVKDGDGKILLSQVNTPGSEQGIKNGKPPFSVVIGHASGVRLYYKGQAVDLAPYTRAQVSHLTLE